MVNICRVKYFVGVFHGIQCDLYLDIVNNNNLRLVQSPNIRDKANHGMLIGYPSFKPNNPKDIDKTNGHLEKCRDDEVNISFYNVLGALSLIRAFLQS